MTTLTKPEVVALGDVTEGDLIRSIHQGSWGDYLRVTGKPRRWSTTPNSVEVPTVTTNGEASRYRGDAQTTTVYRRQEEAA